jgi:hypothetical protein
MYGRKLLRAAGADHGLGAVGRENGGRGLFQGRQEARDGAAAAQHVEDLERRPGHLAIRRREIVHQAGHADSSVVDIGLHAIPRHAAAAHVLVLELPGRLVHLLDVVLDGAGFDAPRIEQLVKTRVQLANLPEIRLERQVIDIGLVKHHTTSR